MNSSLNLKIPFSSVVPSAIVKSYSGLTVEIIDTDAEGRLILADGLGYIAKNIEPDVIIDLATLTGSCIMALGYTAAGMFTENEELAQKLQEKVQAELFHLTLNT